MGSNFQKMLKVDSISRIIFFCFFKRAEKLSKNTHIVSPFMNELCCRFLAETRLTLKRGDTSKPRRSKEAYKKYVTEQQRRNAYPPNKNVVTV